jgi:hypothetical protein
MDIEWYLIEANLYQLEKGERVSRVNIGTLTSQQTETLNNLRETLGLPPVSGKLFFMGRHMYNSRCAQDGYTVNDVMDQLRAALNASSIIDVTKGGRSTVLRSSAFRSDNYDNHTVLDEVILECTSKNPLAEVFSVIPKNDFNKPKK